MKEKWNSLLKNRVNIFILNKPLFFLSENDFYNYNRDIFEILMLEKKKQKIAKTTSDELTHVNLLLSKGKLCNHMFKPEER